MVGGAGSASQGGREQRLAIRADGRHEGALLKHAEQSPSFSGGRRVAPGRWPAQAIREQVAAVTNGRHPKSRAPDGAPPAIDEGAVAVPGNAVTACVVFREGNNPTEGTVWLKRRRSHLYRQQPMQLEVAESLGRERRESEVGSRWGRRPSLRRSSRAAVEPVLESANSREAQLASGVIDPKSGNEAFLAWAHCPQQAADARSPLYLVFQRVCTSPADLGQACPWMRVLMAAVQGTRRVLCLEE